MSVLSFAKHAALAATAATAGAAAGLATHHHGAPAAPVYSTLHRETMGGYQARLNQITLTQASLDQTTDLEAAAHTLDEDKKRFATDAVLDRRLSERDLGALAVHFNQLSKEDGLRLRFHNYNPATVAQRDECLAQTPALKDRFAYAQKIETCMIDTAQAPYAAPNAVTEADQAATDARARAERDAMLKTGGAIGFGLYGIGALALGRRRKGG